MSTVKIPGVLLNLGGRDFIVPPLNFRALRQIQPKLASLTTGNAIPDEAQLDSIQEIVHLAVCRNYPDMQRAELDDLLDLDNLKEVITAIMGVSGLARTTSAEGNLQTPAVESLSAGGTSSGS